MNNINFIKSKTKQVVINNSKTLTITFESFINMLLLDQLTTYQGRLDAIKIKYKMHKLTPIYINAYLCLFPVSNLKDFENTYINAYRVKTIIRLSDATCIVFMDNTKLFIKKNFSLINKYFKRAISINHNS